MDAVAENASQTLSGFLCPILCGNDAACSTNCSRNIQQAADRLKSTMENFQNRLQGKARELGWYAFLATYLPWFLGFVIVLALLWMNRVITCTQLVVALILIVVATWILSSLAASNAMRTLTTWNA